jgi:hypothetical protein
MLFEPVPARPAGRGSRLRTTIAVLGPVAALILIVGAAWQDPGRNSDPGPPLRVADVAQPSRVADRTAEPPLASDRGPVAVKHSVFPATAFRLHVRTVDETRAAHVAGDIDDRPVAVSGFLSIDPRHRICLGVIPVLGDSFCRRAAILTDEPKPIFAVRTGDPSSTDRIRAIGPHLHPQILPGTVLPAELTEGEDTGDAPVEPMPAVVIGRFGDPRAERCRPGGRHCGEEFVLERVAWIDGRWSDRDLARDPAIGPGAIARGSVTRAIASREADRGEVILSRAVVRRKLLSFIDPAAARALGANAGREVWYIRSLGKPPSSTETVVKWAVVGHPTGLVLATGPTPD